MVPLKRALSSKLAVSTTSSPLGIRAAKELLARITFALEDLHRPYFFRDPLPLSTDIKNTALLALMLTNRESTSLLEEALSS